MSTLLAKSAMAAASLLMTAGIVTAAQPAGADVAAPRMVVPTADLNLASSAGIATAERRIRAAASQVCGSEGDLMSPAGQCRAEAISQAEQALQTRVAQR